MGAQRKTLLLLRREEREISRQRIGVCLHGNSEPEESVSKVVGDWPLGIFGVLTLPLRSRKKTADAIVDGPKEKMDRDRSTYGAHFISTGRQVARSD